MSFNFTQEQRDFIRARLEEGPRGGNVQYSDVYAQVAEWLSEVPGADAVRNWFLGATQANSGVGPYATLIREYTRRQATLRDVPISDELIQQASNAVAVRVLNDLLPENSFLTLNDIADYDATEVGRVVFSLLEGDTAFTANAAWAGSLLFSPMGSDQFDRLYTAGSAGSVDTLDDWKNILLAYDSFVYAVKSVATKKSFEHPCEVWDAFKIFMGLPGTNFSDLALDISANLVQASDYEWGPRLSSLFQGTPIEKPFAVMGRYGSAEVLNMMMSAWLGRPTDVADDVNFMSTTVEFFQSLETGLVQSLPMGLIDGVDVEAIRALARIDIQYRNALQALSVFLVDPSAEISASLDMYNVETGTGEITEAWLAARSTFLVFLNQYRSNRDSDGVLDAGAGVPLPFPGDMLFIDNGNRPVQLLVDGLDIGILEMRRFLFGGTGGDILQGGNGDDRLFGMAGADILDGGAGDDHVEGGLGSDELRGGAGSDTLLGMDGADVLIGGSGNDDLQGGRGYDIYEFSGTDGNQRDVVYDLDGSGSLVFDGVALGTIGRMDTNIWQTADGRFRVAAETAAGGNGTDLIILDLSNGSSVLVQSWVAGSLGITLEGYGSPHTPPPLPQPGMWDGEFVPLPGISVDGTHLGTSGNDALYAGFGDDYVEGGVGSDLIGGGPGSDRILGGDGDDIILEGAITGRFGTHVDSSWAANPAVVSYGPGWVALAGNAYRTDARDYYQTLAVYGFFGPLLLGAFSYPDAELYPDAGDIIDAGAGSDIVLGGEGDDLIRGGSGNDVISGGSDDDMVFGDEGDDLIYGDLIDGELRSIETVNNSSMADTSGNDYLDGGDGNDKIYGQNGDDYIAGGAGNDSLMGDGGNDFVDGGNGNDQIYGGVGSDVLLGGNGNDNLNGDAGDDQLHGGEGRDWLYGGSGRDVYQFGRGDGWDSVMDSDDDSIFEIIGDIDSAELVVRRSNNDLQLSLRGTEDQLSVLGFFATEPELSSATIRFANGIIWNALDVAEMARRPSEDADTIIGTDGDDVLYGAGGADKMEGRGGNDIIYGGSDNDTIYGQGGSNILYGEQGDDILYASGGDNDVAFGGEGDDQLFGYSDWSELYGGAGDDLLQSLQGISAITQALLDGGSGNDVLKGGYGDDVYIFGRGYDRDTIYASVYSDVPHHDILKFKDGISPEDLEFGLEPGTFGSMDVVVKIRGTSDQVTIMGGLRLNNEQRAELNNGLETIEFADGTLWGKEQVLQAFVSARAAPPTPGHIPIDIQLGTEAGDTIISASDNVSIAWGFGGDDIMQGGSGIDNYHGNAGNDVIRGGAGDDELFGGSGDDVLHGGMGLDRLAGGDGGDTYIYNLGDGFDYIGDYGDEPGVVSGEMTGTDRLTFGEGINPGDVSVSRDNGYGSSLVLSFSHDQNAGIQITRQFEQGQDVAGSLAIEEIQFFDGTVWDIDHMAQLAALSVASPSLSSQGASTEAALLIQAISLSVSGADAVVAQHDEYNWPPYSLVVRGADHPSGSVRQVHLHRMLM